MHPRLVAAALVSLLLLPTAAAFPGGREDVDRSYAAADAPLMLMSGAVTTNGTIGGGLVVGGAVGTRIGPIPTLVLTGVDGQNATQETLRGVTLVIHQGSFIANPRDGTIGVDLSTPYALVMAMSSPPGGGDGSPDLESGGFAIGGVELTGALAFGADEFDVIPVDAVISVEGASGRALAGWDHREVNRGRTTDEFEPSAQPEGVLLQATGPFPAELRASAALGTLGEHPTFAVSTEAADDMRFAEAVASISAIAGGADGMDMGMLENFEFLAGLLNGGALILPAPSPDAGAEGAAPTNVSLLRAEGMRVGWNGEKMDMHANEAMAISSTGFAVAPPLVVRGIPLLAALFWIGAIVALVFFFVRRPPKTDEKFRQLRLTAFAVHLAALALAFWWWDRQFKDSFGTSVLTMLADGAGSDDLLSLGITFGLQMLPWTLAALLFALPVRIAVGVLLRYRGKGKAMRGYAKAAGLVALAVLGPFYALWMLNTVMSRAMGMIPAP